MSISLAGVAAPKAFFGDGGMDPEHLTRFVKHLYKIQKLISLLLHIPDPEAQDFQAFRRDLVDSFGRTGPFSFPFRGNQPVFFEVP
jgi:hypothetical protein